MKKFTFYYKKLNGEHAKVTVEASNHGIAKNRFKQSVIDCLKIKKIEKEK